MINAFGIDPEKQYDVTTAMAHLSRITDMTDEERAAYAALGHVPRYAGAVTMQCQVCRRDVEVGPKTAEAVRAGAAVTCIFCLPSLIPEGENDVKVDVGHLGGESDPRLEYLG